MGLDIGEFNKNTMKLQDHLYKALKQRDQYKSERDSLIEDVEKLREEKAAIEMYLDAVKVYKPMYEKLNKKYNRLTEHIRLKALHNPSVSRYKDLMHFIDELEGGFNAKEKL